MIKFTESNKWRDPWFRKLKVGEKLLFLFLCDNCDNAGFYELDLEFMAFSIGVEEEKIKIALTGLERGVVCRDNWVWIKNYLKHQRNLPLNPGNNSHKQILNIINLKLSTFPEMQVYLGAKEGLISPIGISKGKGIGKSREYSEAFELIWKQYPKPVGKQEAFNHYKASVLTEDDSKNIYIALSNYNKSNRVLTGHIQDGSTWFNNWHDWINYVEPVMPKSDQPPPKQSGGRDTGYWEGYKKGEVQ
jgi:hypothetical protein